MKVMISKIKKLILTALFLGTLFVPVLILAALPVEPLEVTKIIHNGFIKIQPETIRLMYQIEIGPSGAVNIRLILPSGNMLINPAT